jgi:hypothetical protein
MLPALVPMAIRIYSTFVESARSESEGSLTSTPGNSIGPFSAAGLKFLTKFATASVNFPSSPNKK